MSIVNNENLFIQPNYVKSEGFPLFTPFQRDNFEKVLRITITHEYINSHLELEDSPPTT